jgi:omega-amidase
MWLIDFNIKLLVHLLPLLIMKISVIQPDTVWEDKCRNFENISALVTPLFNNTDLVILPEMFNTGFSMNPEKLCEPADGETFKWMKNMSKAGNFGLCGSYIVKQNMKFYNRWVFVSPENTVSHYDKRHLFSMGGEDKHFTAGKSRLIFSFRGVKLSPYICYDLRFPVWSRNREISDLIIYSANWPESRKDVWDTLLKARAIENQCYVAGSNRTGTDKAGVTYCGKSVILSPRGEIIKSAESTGECMVTAEISLTGLTDFRNKFPVANDADKFTLDL